jgi:hypothetical protein
VQKHIFNRTTLLYFHRFQTDRKKIPTEKKAKEEIFVIQPVTATVKITDGTQIFWQNSLILP